MASCFTTSKVVVEKSTVPVRSAARVAELLNLQSPSHVSLEICRPQLLVKLTSPRKNRVFCQQCSYQLEHTVLSNPEFLAEGTAIKDLLYPDRILIGGDENSPAGRRGLEMLTWVYKHWIPEERILLTSVWSSELSKLVSKRMVSCRTLLQTHGIYGMISINHGDINEHISEVMFRFHAFCDPDRAIT